MSQPASTTPRRAATSLDGRIAVVSGGGHGIGRAASLALAAHGASVAVLDIDEAAGRETVEAIEREGGHGIARECDVADRLAVENSIGAVTTHWGRLDVVVSNAGTIHAGTVLLESSDEEWRRTFAIHVDGAFFLTRAAVPFLRRSPGGRIILTSSIWAQSGPGHSYAYCAAKGALVAFARNLAVELAADGVCVNAIAPGGVRTRMADALTEEELRADIETIPLHRYAEPEEIAAVIAFLSSDAAAFITGQTIAVNGGQLIGAS